MMSHQQKLFPQKSEQEEEEHETCTNLKGLPLREGPNEEREGGHIYGVQKTTKIVSFKRGKAGVEMKYNNQKS